MSGDTSAVRSVTGYRQGLSQVDCLFVKLILPKKVFFFQLQDRWGVDRDGLIVCPALHVYFHAWMSLYIIQEAIIHETVATRYTGASWHGTGYRGGRWLCQSVCCWYPCPVRNTAVSSNGRAESCMPMGNPVDVKPQGTDIAGTAARLKGPVPPRGP